MIDLDLSKAPSSILDAQGRAFTVSPTNYEAIKSFAQFFRDDQIIQPSVMFFGLFESERIIAFNSIVPQSCNGTVWGHRLAVIPERRGRGLGIRFDEWVGAALHASGYSYVTEVDPSMLPAFENSLRWVERDPRGNPRVFTYCNK